MHILLTYTVCEDYPARRVPFRSAHLAHARAAFERGELALAGALDDPPDGAVLVFRGGDPAIAEMFARADPYVQNGLVTEWKTRKWSTVIGDGAKLPELPPE
ncbi:MAG: YciI family protein [Armatimonadetes bacterium]|nr:YciI family protein [Armatimonadota bacterium]MDE2207696.1 YciI family protein [Armatimonadota bacterium]